MTDSTDATSENTSTNANTSTTASSPDGTTNTTSPDSAIDTTSLDSTIDRWWDRLRGNELADRVLFGASNVGEFSILWHLLGAIRALGPRSKAGDAVRFSALMALESLIVNQGIKRLFSRGRPGSAADNTTVHRLRQPTTSSFPSGHASAAFCAAAVLSHRSPLAPFYRLAALVVSASRIHVRLHHASDVLAGAVIGEAIGRAAVRLMRR